MERLKKALPLAVPVAVLLLSVACCLLLYHYDNKYTYPGPQAKQGMLLLDEADGQPVVFLVEGWAYYGGRLLTPRDFEQQAPVPDEYLFIGQYGGFERAGRPDSPHGSATYRLRILLPEGTRQYMLELPEIFSAYRLYINGREMAAMGTPEPEGYTPATGNRWVTFEASGTLDILVAVSDYSHFYSGMVYPPAFGEPYAVSRLLNARLVVRSILCGIAAIVGLLSVLVGLISRRGLPVRYGLLCLCFIGYTGYPVWRSFTSWYGPLYLLENLCFCAVLLLAVSMQATLHQGRRERTYTLPLLGFGGFMILFTVLVHASLGQAGLGLLAAYSYLVSFYQWVVAAFLTVTSFLAAGRGAVGSRSMLCAALALDGALVMDRLLPLFEPVVTGWFAELAAALLVGCIGLAIAKDVAWQYRQSAVLAEQIHGAERLLKIQQTYHHELEREAERTRLARHDLRHHFTTVKELLQAGEYEALSSYLKQYGGSIPSDGAIRYCANPVANAVADYYTRVAAMQGIALELRLEIAEHTVLPDTELSSVLSNLLENAVEACGQLAEGKTPRISFHAREGQAALALYMENTAGEILRSDKGFLSRKKPGRVGYGLQSVRSVAEKYNGTVAFRFQPEKGLFTSTVLLPKQ